MADELTNYLLNGNRHAKLSPESLELLGKQAANMYLNDGLSLNESIAKLAAAYQDISQEQVKRIVEFANSAVYLAKHDQNKTAGAASSYPQFDLADAGRIIQDLSDGARPTVMTPVDLEYSRIPTKKEKVAAVQHIAEMFGADDNSAVEKTASADFSKETAVTEIMGAKNMLTGLKDNLESSVEKMDLMLKEAKAAYYDLVKRHLLDGGDFSDVMAAARSSEAEDEKIASIVQPVVVQLMSEKVASEKRLMNGVRNLEKVAYRVVNEKHPLVVEFKNIVTLEDEVEKVANGLFEVDTELKKVDQIIKEQLRASGSTR
jgi:hypothetical protein